MKTEAQGPASKHQAAFAGALSSVISDPKIVGIPIEHNTSGTLADNFTSGALDLDDTLKFKDGPGPSSAGVLLGHITEQYFRQAAGITGYPGHDLAHAAASRAITEATGWTRGVNTGSPLSASNSGTTTTTWSNGAQTITVVIQWQNGNIVSIIPAR